MTELPDIPDEHRSFEDTGPPSEPQPVKQNGHAPEPPPSQAGEPDLDGRFGTLKQYALNRWKVRDRQS